MLEDRLQHEVERYLEDPEMELSDFEESLDFFYLASDLHREKLERLLAENRAAGCQQPDSAP